MTPEELEHLTFAHLSEGFVRSMLKAVFQAHEVAWRDCRGAFSAEEAENVMPYYRRGKLEGLLRDVAGRFPTMSAQVLKADQSNWNHTEVRSGPVVLTENSVQTPCAPVDKAEFRRTLAESSQLTLWDEPRADDLPLYVLLLHSRSRWETAADRQKWGHLPGSAYLAFPARDLDSYVHEINLFDRFADVVRAAAPNEWDGEAEVRYFSRARKVRMA